MRATISELHFAYNKNGYINEGYTRAQAKQLSHCEVWRQRTEPHGKLFTATCLDCLSTVRTEDINTVIELIKGHKGHRIRILAGDRK